MPLTLEEAARWRDDLHAAGKRLVFTSGCFDILHAGHTRYLAEARLLGDALLVAVNADESVRRLKGPSRPVNPAEDRVEVLEALRSVDAVLVFKEERTTPLLAAIRPHVFAKGGDYTIDSLNPEERAAAEAGGADIRILPVVEGRSTTATLARMALPETGGAAPDPVSSPLPRIGVLGSGEGSNFGAILDAIRAGTLRAEVALVLSDVADARILERARERGIPARALTLPSASGRLPDGAQREIADLFTEAGVDLVVCAGFMRRLREPVLSRFPGRILNIHPSLLPAFPGKDAWAQAHSAGVSETGCTAHLIDAGLDTGEPLARSVVPVLPDDTAEDVRRRIQAAEHVLYPAVIGRVLEERVARA